MKKIILSLVVFTFVIIFGSVLVNNSNRELRCADIDCPMCGSVEVFDFGYNADGQRCHCADCGINFSIN